MKIIVGIDIGGTKCAITFAALEQEEFTFLDKVKEQTITEDAHRAIARFIQVIRQKLDANPAWELVSIGISCGGPLDASRGLILAPPNLPLWDNVDIYTPLREAFGVPVAMENDANACALAEWVHGAGKGTRNMVFLTFGTGMGAEMMQPMAVVTIGGLSYATLMTLFIVPALYDIVNGEKMSAREIQMAQEAAGMEGNGGDE